MDHVKKLQTAKKINWQRIESILQKERKEAEEVENAHEAGFSCGKYKVFLEIQELDPRITAKEVKNMSMKEMRDLLKELSGTDQEKPEPHEKRKRHGKCK